MTMRWLSLTFVALAFFLTCAALQPQIPSVASFIPASNSTPFILSSNVRIVVDSKYANAGNPSLYTFASTFREDLIDVSGFTKIPAISIGSLVRGLGGGPVIFLTLGATSNHTLFNGKQTGEGYDFVITKESYVIKGVQPIGTWWGTRTLLQQVTMMATENSEPIPLSTSGRLGVEWIERNGTSTSIQTISLPAGIGSDTPGWEVRGFMLDVGRHWFETSFLADLCTYASFFKLNEFHMHASDNLWNPLFLYGSGNEGWKHLYAGFRFLPPSGSSLEGLVPLKNESWSHSEFSSLQSSCAAHGVIIIPEIDTPGHSLAIAQWKPQLIIQGEPDHLNLSRPETIPTIKSIWSEFLPWFAGPEVSIGADEYDAAFADQYIAFVNEMNDYINAESGKKVRIWGTHEPSTTMFVSRNITIQHWDFPGDDVPIQLMEKGYEVINSEQHFLYLDGKTSDNGQFPQELNKTLMWGGAPGGKGWAPNIFSPVDESNNTGIGNPRLRGSIFALWNDWGNNATTQLEVYYQLAQSIAVFSEKTWAGSGVRLTALTREQFDTVYPILNAVAPGQNLNRVIVSKRGNIVYSYDLSHMELPVTTPYESVGPPYTLTFSVNPGPFSPSKSLLFSGLDSKLHLHNLAFEDTATKQLYALNYTLPLDKYSTVAIHATREYTYAVIDGDEGNKLWWTTTMDIWGEYMAVGNMSFAAPAQTIGCRGFVGAFGHVELKLGN